MAKTPAKKTVRKKVPAKAKTPPATVPANTVEAPAQPKPRRLRKPQYKSFKIHKHIKSEGASVPGAFYLFRSALALLLRYWKLFLGISLVYGVLNFVLVQGFSVTSLNDAKDSVQQLSQGSWGWLTGGLSLFAYLLTNDTSGAVAGGSVYQIVIQLIVSLAIIWTLRQLHAGNKVGIRDGFYQGVYPFVPFVLVLVIMALQAVPAAIGIYLYTLVNSNNIAVTTVEQVLWAIVGCLAILLSLYMICASTMALYIVSLPNVGPVAAVRSAAGLVQFRRWAVLRKVLFLPVVLLVIGAAVLIPVILVWTPAAPWTYLLLTMLILPVVHSYYYALYRSLL